MSDGAYLGPNVSGADVSKADLLEGLHKAFFAHQAAQLHLGAFHCA
jgi:hypothetical protein